MMRHTDVDRATVPAAGHYSGAKHATFFKNPEFGKKTNVMRDKPIIDLAFVFGPFSLIPSQQLLLRQNRPVKLGGRALDLLLLLLTRTGQEVSKSELIAFAWPKVFVDEHNLKVHISGLRRVLGDTLPQATYIATVVGRGYQFVGTVRTERVEITDFSDVYVQAERLPLPAILIGRNQDVESVTHALDVTRLITLVGPGGVGKTSLALAVAHSKQDAFPDGVHIADLSQTDNPALVPHLVATCLGVRGSPSDLIAAVVEHLQDRRILLILDNCEHVLPAASTIAARLVEANINSCLLATSREPLGVSGENLHRVRPLTFPPRQGVRGASEALAYSSIELFALRAHDIADYHLIDDDIEVVARLCEAMDGIPLAIEIAVAKLVQFSLADLFNSVSQCLNELRNEQEGAHPRHRTLWAMLDWSYRLLSVEEAAIFRLLSVFSGSFESDDISYMASLVDYDPYQTTIALGGLVNKSLLAVELDGDQLRYRILESAKSYATEALRGGPIARDAQHHHARLLLAVLTQSAIEWIWVEPGLWRARYEGRRSDMRKALDWCFGAGGDAPLGVDLTIAALRLLSEQSSVFEHLFQVDRALKYCPVDMDASPQTATLAHSRAQAMTLARQSQSDTEGAWDTALAYAELGGDAGRHLDIMLGKSIFLIFGGRHNQAVSLLDKVTLIATNEHDRGSLHDAERLRAMANMHLGKLAEVRSTLERLSDDLAQGVPPSKAMRYPEERYVSIHATLAFSYWLTGQPERGIMMAEEMLTKLESTDQLMGQWHTLWAVGLPLALLSRNIDKLERYVMILRNNLSCEDKRVWAPYHGFYASAVKHGRGDPDGVDEMRSAIDDLVRDGTLSHTPMYLSVVAEALLERGRTTDASDAIAAALNLLCQTGEGWCLSELLRVKARILASSGQLGLAKSELVIARGKAAEIGALYFERRISADLAHLAITDE
jgi:predicted ATPase/DNA-binding winged helix-turn-helix (wHTH) protein